jgi:hypothetical protein
VRDAAVFGGGLLVGAVAGAVGAWFLKPTRRPPLIRPPPQVAENQKTVTARVRFKEGR